MTTCTHLDQVEVRQLPDSVDCCEECLKVADPDPQVVDGAVGQASSRSQWTASTLLPSGSSRNPPVVGRAVLRARPGRTVVAVSRVDPGLPEGVDLRAVAGTEPDEEPAGHRVLAVLRTDVPVVPLDQLGVCMAGARRPGRSGRCGRSARRPRGPRPRCRRGRTPGRGYRCCQRRSWCPHQCRTRAPPRFRFREKAEASEEPGLP
jgi:hypothetical protein